MLFSKPVLRVIYTSYRVVRFCSQRAFIGPRIPIWLLNLTRIRFLGPDLIFLKQSAKNTSKSYILTHLNPFSSQTKGFFRTFLKWGFVALTTNFLGT
jgi:hypothetical protein